MASGPERDRVDPLGQREPAEEAAERLAPGDAVGHVGAQAAVERPPVRRVELARGRDLALEVAGPAVGLDHLLAEPARALVGRLLGRRELGDHLARAGRPAEPHAGAEDLRERARPARPRRAPATTARAARRRRRRSRGRRRPRGSARRGGGTAPPAPRAARAAACGRSGSGTRGSRTAASAPARRPGAPQRVDEQAVLVDRRCPRPRPRSGRRPSARRGRSAPRRRPCRRGRSGSGRRARCTPSRRW